MLPDMPSVPTGGAGGAGSGGGSGGLSSDVAYVPPPPPTYIPGAPPQQGSTAQYPSFTQVGGQPSLQGQNPGSPQAFQPAQSLPPPPPQQQQQQPPPQQPPAGSGPSSATSPAKTETRDSYGDGFDLDDIARRLNDLN
eukprot:gnl/Chilomastix_caulleri/507.p4 GENE.gnl/Chilomastix_caulleri/507~~gnl/Chilomastix_caulleri/507.p4  ORF type:complete len:138 (+),score=67.48 gnl/Chilomastix_caulleri/507:572-985(+)